MDRKAESKGPGKAYKNEEFIDTRDARPLRILAEYLEPEARFKRLHVHDTIIFFGSARTLSKDEASAALETAKAEGGNVRHAEMQLHMARYYEDARTLAHRLSEWSMNLDRRERRFLVCTGGGPGIMEAANRGASEANALNIGLTISMPTEEFDNPYVTRDLSFEFHYFFMRKFWFSYMAKAVVQTLKMKKRPPIVLFGSEFWSKVLDLEALASFGTIDEQDLDLFLRTDSVDEAFDFITSELATIGLSDSGPSL
jgi:predicted Rossmann-fold nucleotide-binding protein